MIILLILSTVLITSAKNIVQFSGFIRDIETSSPIPYAAIYIYENNRGTISGPDGFFSFAVAEGDTIIVSSLGYKTFTLVIPKNIGQTSFAKEILLDRDPIMLDEVLITPLPEPHQLRQAILSLNIPDNLAELAQQTIANSIINDEIERNTQYDGAENYNAYVKSQTEYYYNRFGNQRPGISLTDPFAWAKFIQSIKDKKKRK